MSSSQPLEDGAEGFAAGAAGQGEDGGAQDVPVGGAGEVVEDTTAAEEVAEACFHGGFYK
jgi:hypothetical protein